MTQTPTAYDLSLRLSELLKDTYQKFLRPSAEKFQRQPLISGNYAIGYLDWKVVLRFKAIRKNVVNNIQKHT